MALVKINVTCPHCKVDHEEYDATQYDDKEKYLAYWNIEFGTPEAEQAWQDKLGMTPKEANHKFGFLLGAFEYGAPPHGGIAFGFDRLCALLGGSESIRDFIAFPKNNSGRDVMLDAPSSIDDKQFEELHIKLNLK
jgi:aspartyl-tRNA synthetase